MVESVEVITSEDLEFVVQAERGTEGREEEFDSFPARPVLKRSVTFNSTDDISILDCSPPR